MEEKEKPFDTAWIVLLLVIAFFNDAGTLFFSILALTGVGVVGEVIMGPLNAVVGAFYTILFFMKLGFGGESLLMLGGSLVEFLIPSRLITVGIAIFLANHPKLAAVAEVAGGAVLTGGAGAIAAEAGGAAEAGAVATEASAATEAGAATAEAGAATEGTTASVQAETATTEGGAQGTESTRGETETTRGTGETEEASQEKGGETSGEQEKEEELEREMETKEERSPEETMTEELFEKISQANNNEEDEEQEEGSEQTDQPTNVVSGDEFQKRADEIKKQQQKLKAPKIIDTGEGNDQNRRAAA